MDALADNRALVVLGPTATGKTELAFSLCRRYSGWLIGADSMQIYTGLPVGTATPLETDAPDVHRSLIGFLPPETEFSVADYVAAAQAAVQDAREAGRVPVLCGGTGLYISSFLNGIDFGETGAPFEAARERLFAEWDEAGGADMLAKLACYDAEHAGKLHENDKKRIINALAYAEVSNTTYSQRAAASRKKAAPECALVIGVDARERKLLYERIERRVDDMLENGVLDEAHWVFENRAQFKTAVQAIGYKEFFPYFNGEATLDECVLKLKQATRNYAKRQLTWFRRMQNVNWLYIEDGKLEEKATVLAQAFLQA